MKVYMTKQVQEKDIYIHREELTPSDIVRKSPTEKAIDVVAITVTFFLLRSTVKIENMRAVYRKNL